MTEPDLMHHLSGLLADAGVRSSLAAIAGDLLDELRDDPSRPKSTFRSIPLAVYGALPPAIRSSWLFALRGGLAHPPERHPNSIQRMFALTAPGRFDWWDGGQWVTAALVPGDDGLSIPADTWHRMPAQDEDWVVASFHTAAADELVEIVGEPASGAIESTRAYLAGDGA
jgi:hypothetical protein